MDLQPKDVKRLRKRDKLEKTRDVVIIGSAGAGAYGAVKGGRAVAKAASATRTEVGRVGKAVRDASKKVNSREVAKEGARLVKKKASKSFPTITRIAKALTKKRKFLQSNNSVVEFGGKGQIRDVENDRFVDPLKVASGLRTGYFPDSEGQRIPAKVGIGHAQVIKAAYNKGKKIERTAGRGGRLVRDARDVVTGRERRKDAAGRKKKREWEKAWFRKTAGAAAAGAGVLGYAHALKKNPRLKARHVRTVGRVKRKVNEVIPDAFTDFDTPASRLLHLDAVAKEAGWDVRDPRGRSARVFAPGSRRRNRRQKKWHEKAGNERKLWKAGVVGALLAGGAAGAVAGRKLGKTVGARPALASRLKRPVPGSGKAHVKPRRKVDLVPPGVKRRKKLRVV